MSIAVSFLTTAAAKFGAPIIKGILEKHLGGGLAGSLAGQVVDEIATKAGVTPDELEMLPDEQLEAAIKETELNTPEIINMWLRGTENQFALIKEDNQLGFFNMFWRAGWMYLLAGFWLWRIVVIPIIEMRGNAIEAVDYGHLLTLTGWFMALYMGGHTLKTIGQNVVDSVQKRKGDGS